VILVDTSVWIDHLRSSDQRLVALLHDVQVQAHPWVIGELALGRLAQREEFLHLLSELPQATVVSSAEIMLFLADRRLYGLGIGYVDLQLLGATVVAPGTRLWTRDKRLAAVARRLGVAA